MSTTVRTCLWFDGQAEQAATFYCGLIANSRLTGIHRPMPDGPALMVNFELDGVPYQALNGGPQFQFTEAASISVTTADQAETDRLWDALCDGGQESKCGWLKDRWGLSWQIVPAALPQYLGHPDRAAAARAMQAMLGMRKLVIAELQAAVDAA